MEKEKSSLRQRTEKGLFWGAINSGTTQLLNLLFGIVLGRLLTPAEYGIVGVLAIFTAIAADLQSSGFTQGLVNLRSPQKRDYNAVFTFNVSVSLAMYIMLFCAAPWIADFFHQPCLVEVSRVVFLTFLIASLGIAHGGYMAKNMMNREIAIIGFIALLASGITGVSLAFGGFGYWALAWQQVVYVTVINIGRYYYVSEWQPRLTADMSPVTKMAPFAVNILLTKIITTLSNNILVVIFGRLFPIAQVGNYSQAYKWDTMASAAVANTVGQVAQPVLFESSEGKEERQKRVFRKMMRFTSFLSMPLMFGLAIISREFILVTIGVEWADCVPLLQVLCLSGAFLPLYTMYQNLAISRGRSDIFMRLSVSQIVAQLIVILTTYRYGMFCMVCLYSALMVAWLLPWHIVTHKMIHYRWRELAADIMPYSTAAALVMAVSYMLTLPIANMWILLLSRISVAATLYCLIMFLIRNELLFECLNFVCKRKNEEGK